MHRGAEAVVVAKLAGNLGCVVGQRQAVVILAGDIGSRDASWAVAQGEITEAAREVISRSIERSEIAAHLRVRGLSAPVTHAG